MSISHKTLSRFLPPLVMTIGLSSCGGSDDSEEAASEETITVETECGGEVKIDGAVTLPAAINGRSMRMTVTETSTTSKCSQVQTDTISQNTDTIKFQINNLIEGNYTIRMQVDVTNNGPYTDAGDYDGYYKGTTSSPVFTADTATEITITSENISQSGFDFGLGEVSSN